MFIDNFEQISHTVPIFDFEYVNARMDIPQCF